MDIKDVVVKTSAELLAQHNDFVSSGHSIAPPNPAIITGLLLKIRKAVFPGYFEEKPETELQDSWLQLLLADIHRELAGEIATALMAHSGDPDSWNHAQQVASGLLSQLADIQQALYKDAQAGFDGDPAARSVDEVILTYPGFFAIFVYRVAHYLFVQDVPLIPRIMSEYAHSITGVDIHPGARIGEYFFIDHGTGVVIGETTVIGDYAKIYQGVTLGALSTKGGQKLAGVKRHPTIEDHVTIYSNASILGGETIIGNNAVIGGNVFITKSVEEDTTVRGG